MFPQCSIIHYYTKRPLLADHKAGWSLLADHKARWPKLADHKAGLSLLADDKAGWSPLACHKDDWSPLDDEKVGRIPNGQCTDPRCTSTKQNIVMASMLPV